MTASKCLLALALLAASLPLAACDLDLPDDAAEGDAGSDDGSDDEGDDAPAEESGDEAAQESGDEPPPDDDDADESSGGGDDDAPAPAELLGLWTIEGTTAAAAFALADDGTYARANVGEATIGYCTTRIEITVAGTFVVNGDVLELTPTSALKRVDECGTVTETDDLPAASAVAWELGQDDWGETLTLTEDGSASTYHRG